jgi:hypothetical protein
MHSLILLHKQKLNRGVWGLRPPVRLYMIFKSKFDIFLHEKNVSVIEISDSISGGAYFESLRGHIPF